MLRGISYGSTYVAKNFRSCKDNYLQNVYKPLLENNEVSVYVCTYDHPLMQELIDTYKPKKIELLEYENSDQVTTFLHSLRMLKDEDLDFIICTRFDLHFHQKITDINLDFNKSNFTFKLDPIDARWNDYEFISDLAFYFNSSHLDAMISSTKDLIKFPPRQWADLHGIYKKLKAYIPKEEINFITPNIWRSLGDEYPIYELKRN